MVLPWVPVATAPPTVWSMNHGNAASVQPLGAAADLRWRGWLGHVTSTSAAAVRLGQLLNLKHRAVPYTWEVTAHSKPEAIRHQGLPKPVRTERWTGSQAASAAGLQQPR
jgi:hypothetical protein